jgi:hypothetical protein
MYGIAKTPSPIVAAATTAAMVKDLMDIVRVGAAS